MAYPTGIVFLPTSPVLGMQPINEASDTKRHELGTVVRATDITYGEGTFIYLVGVASTVAGDVVCYNSKTGGTVRAVAGGATSVGSVAVAMSACTASLYGWYALAGSVPVTAATVLADTQAYLTSTAGSVDDAASATAVIGLTFKAATSGGFATAQLAFPSIDATALTGTTQTIAGAKTFSGLLASSVASGSPAIEIESGARFALDGATASKYFWLNGSEFTLVGMSLTWPGNAKASNANCFLTVATTNGEYMFGVNSTGALTSGSFYAGFNNGVRKYDINIFGKQIVTTGAATDILGTATLVGGTVTVTTSQVTAKSRIFMTRNTPGGTPGYLSAPVASFTAGTSFVINSTSGTDTSTVNWYVIDNQ